MVDDVRARRAGSVVYRIVLAGGPEFDQVANAFAKYVKGGRPGDADWTAEDSFAMGWVGTRPFVKKTMNLEQQTKDLDPVDGKRPYPDSLIQVSAQKWNYLLGLQDKVKEMLSGRMEDYSRIIIQPTHWHQLIQFFRKDI